MRNIKFHILLFNPLHHHRDPNIIQYKVNIWRHSFSMVFVDGWMAHHTLLKTMFVGLSMAKICSTFPTFQLSLVLEFSITRSNVGTPFASCHKYFLSEFL